MDLPSPEPPPAAAAAPAAAAPSPSGIISDAVAAVADAAAAAAGFDPLVSNSSSSSLNASSQSLEFDSTAACVGLGGSAWTCFKKELPDSQIATSLWLWTAVGLACLLLFCALLHLIPTYRTRLFLPNLWVDPPALPTGEEKEKDKSSSHRRNRKGRSKRRSLRAAFSRLFGWLVTVVTVPDAVILESAGLDALVLTWCFKLGMQIFFPLALVALFVLLPVNILGQGVKQGVLSSAAAAAAAAAKVASNSTLAFQDAAAAKAAKAAAEARPGFTSFSKFTLTNLPHGSPLHWFAFAFVYLSTFWTLFLLRRYNRAYVLLRQKYVTGGEALLSAWHEAYLARAAQAAEEAERAQEEAEERRLRQQEEEEEEAAAAAAAAASAALATASNDSNLPPLHASPSSPVTRGGRRRGASGAGSGARAPLFPGGGGGASGAGGASGSSNSAPAPGGSSAASSPGGLLHLSHSGGGVGVGGSSRRTLGAALRGAMGVFNTGDDLLSAANDPNNSSSAAVVGLSVSAAAAAAAAAGRASSATSRDNPISPREGGIASAAARAAGRLQSRRPLAVDVASLSPVASTGASPPPHHRSPRAPPAAAAASARPSSSPTRVFDERTSSGDAAAAAARSPSLLPTAGSSPTTSQRATPGASRGPPSLSRVSVGAPGHFYYYSFPEAGVDMRRGSDGGGGEAAAAAAAAWRCPSIGGGAGAGAARGGAATRSASGGLPSPSPRPHVPLLSLPPKPPSLSSQLLQQQETTALPSTSSAAAAASSSPQPSPFASPLKPFSEEEEIEGEEEDGSRRGGAGGFLERAPPVSRYERDAPPPPPLADRPIQWWRSNAAAAAVASNGGAGVGAKVSSSSSKRKAKKSGSRRCELSSHPCEVGESGEDLEQGKLPGEGGEEGPSEDESEEEEEEEDPIVGKPNVRDRKLVPALTLDGRLVAAPAEQYAVLVMDVPDLPAAAERARERRAWKRGGGGGERVAEVIGGDGDAGDDDSGGDFGTSGLEPASSPSSRPSSILRAAALGSRAGGRFVKHVILGKRRLAVSAEVMAAARSRAAAEEASRRSGRQGQANASSSEKAGAVVVGGRNSTTTSSTEGKEAAAAAAEAKASTTTVEAEKAAAAVAAVVVIAPEEKQDDDQTEQQQNQQPPSPTLQPLLLEDLLDDDVPIEPSIIVEETFRRLFPESFRTAVPVFRHKEVDLLLLRWDRTCAALEAAEARFEGEIARKGGCISDARRPTMRDRTARKTGRLRWFSNTFAPPTVDAIDALARRVRDLESKISKARSAALSSRPTSSFFVFFDSQRDAAIAAQVNLQAEDGHSFTVVDAPGPEEVLWQTLWMPWAERDLRRLAVLPALALLLLVPIGFFLGGASQITLFLCRIDGFRTGTGALCGSSFMRALTSILPPLLLSLWNGVILPKLLYWLALAEGRSASLSALDRRVCDVYFLFDVVNVFLGTVLGGSLFNSLRTLLQSPGSVLKTLGAAAPTVSSFWMNFLVLQAAALVPSRFLFPHPGVLGDLWRASRAGMRRFGAWIRGCCGGGGREGKSGRRSGGGGGRRSSGGSGGVGGGKNAHSPFPPTHPPRSAHASMDALWPHSIRYGKEIGACLLIFVVALSYAPLSPPVPAVAAAYFLVSWLWWRFSALYVFERAYESGGRLFPHVVRAVLWALFLSEALVGLVFVSRGAYAQATLLWFGLTPVIYSFGASVSRYGRAVDRTPLEAAAAAPRAEVEAIVYTPPALRPRCAGWWPEAGKAWEGWKAPLYVR